MSDAIMQAGIQGIQGGLDQFGRASSQIASSFAGSATNSNQSLVDSLVEIKQAQRSVEASAKVVSVADSLVGSIIDKLA